MEILWSIADICALGMAAFYFVCLGWLLLKRKNPYHNRRKK